LELCDHARPEMPLLWDLSTSAGEEVGIETAAAKINKLLNIIQVKHVLRISHQSCLLVECNLSKSNKSWIAIFPSSAPEANIGPLKFDVSGTV